MKNKVLKTSLIIIIIIVSIFLSLFFYFKNSCNKYGITGTLFYKKKIKQDIKRAGKYIENKYNIETKYINGYPLIGGTNFNIYYEGAVLYFEYGSRKIKVVAD